MTKSRLDRILGLVWVAVGVAELSLLASNLVSMWRLTGHTEIPAMTVGLLPFAVLFLLLIAGGLGIVFGQKWAWVLTLVVAILWSAFSCLAAAISVVNIWLPHPDRVIVPTMVRMLVTTLVLLGLTIWTVQRSFGWSRRRHSGSTA